ncbi:MAG: response regulator transcription factor [Bacteroidota bacterium]|nr:response regulator transcription factor [Bacteroidota bacterium]
MNKPSILIIDDEPQIRKLLEINLENNDYQVWLAGTGKEGVSLAASHLPDLIILDLGLPDKSGHEILKELRSWYNKSIIILSVKSSESDIVTALDSGATDYLVKPFRTGELLARIRSCLRSRNTQENNHLIICNDLQIDIPSRTVKKNNQLIKLTATEFNLFALLVKNEGKVLTHHFILKEIWGIGYQNEMQYLRVFIGALRKKIEDDHNNPSHIRTESGVGYRFV